jgi:hypothetical protein
MTKAIQPWEDLFAGNHFQFLRETDRALEIVSIGCGMGEECVVQPE